jgi:hypothetical protein
MLTWKVKVRLKIVEGLMEREVKRKVIGENKRRIQA